MSSPESSPFGSWRLVVAACAALVVVAGGVGIGFMQLRAGEEGEQGPPNVDTSDWVSRRGDGWLLRHPADWSYRPAAARSKGGIASSASYEFAGTSLTQPLPPTLAAVAVAFDPALAARPATEAPTPFPVAVEAAVRDPAGAQGGILLRIPIVVLGKAGWSISAWMGDAIGRRDAEIVRRVVSSFGFEAASRAGGLTLEEQMIAHEVAESYRGARTALKGRPHTHPGFATDQTGSPDCPNSRCGLVVFRITGGLRFRVLVDIPERRVIAFR